MKTNRESAQHQFIPNLMNCNTSRITVKLVLISKLNVINMKWHLLSIELKSN